MAISDLVVNASLPSSFLRLRLRLTTNSNKLLLFFLWKSICQNYETHLPICVLVDCPRNPLSAAKKEQRKFRCSLGTSTRHDRQGIIFKKIRFQWSFRRNFLFHWRLKFLVRYERIYGLEETLEWCHKCMSCNKATCALHSTEGNKLFIYLFIRYAKQVIADN